MKLNKPSRREEIIRILDKELLSCKELALKLGVGTNYTRNMVDNLKKSLLVTKSYIDGNVFYTLSNRARVKAPLFMGDSNGDRIAISLANLLPSYGKRTKTSVAAESLPGVAARLLMIGNKYETIRNTTPDDSESYSKQMNALKHELRLLKMETSGYHKQMSAVTQVLKDIHNNQDFWNPATLSNYFVKYVDENNAIKTVIEPDEVELMMDAYADYIRKNT